MFKYNLGKKSEVIHVNMCPNDTYAMLLMHEMVRNIKDKFCWQGILILTIIPSVSIVGKDTGFG